MFNWLLDLVGASFLNSNVVKKIEYLGIIYIYNLLSRANKTINSIVSFDVGHKRYTVYSTCTLMISTIF